LLYRNNTVGLGQQHRENSALTAAAELDRSCITQDFDGPRTRNSSIFTVTVTLREQNGNASGRFPPSVPIP
jgi:hypothetical protein